MSSQGKWIVFLNKWQQEFSYFKSDRYIPELIFVLIGTAASVRESCWYIRDAKASCVHDDYSGRRSRTRWWVHMWLLQRIRRSNVLWVQSLSLCYAVSLSLTTVSCYLILTCLCCPSLDGYFYFWLGWICTKCIITRVISTHHFSNPREKFLVFYGEILSQLRGFSRLWILPRLAKFFSFVVLIARSFPAVTSFLGCQTSTLKWVGLLWKVDGW